MAMSKRYAIELHFNPGLEIRVLKAWDVMGRRQISTRLMEIQSRPHITLFSTRVADPSKLGEIIRIVAYDQDPLPLSLSSIGSFPNDDKNNNVLFLSPIPSRSLLQLHSRLCDAMEEEGLDVGEQYRPASWIPYCPVAEQVPKPRMAEAFTALRELDFPVTGHAMDIGVVELSPAREHFSFVLGRNVEA